MSEFTVFRVTYHLLSEPMDDCGRRRTATHAVEEVGRPDEFTVIADRVHRKLARKHGLYDVVIDDVQEVGATPTGIG